MNSTFVTLSLTFIFNSSTTNIDLWFIPIDILMIVCVVLGMAFALLFFIIIILDKACHTVPMMLVANTCLAEVLFGIVLIGLRTFTLQNDLKRIQYQDLFCSFRGYMGYATCSIQNCSYLLQAIYRFVIVTHPTCLFWQSVQLQLLLICLTWIFGFLYPIAFMFTGELIYSFNNQICQLPLRLSFSIIYMASCAYVIPVSLTIFIYFKLVRHVKAMSNHVTVVNTLSRAQRHLKMVRRTVILVSILFTLCFPYAMFIFLSFFMDIPLYHFRIAYVFLDVSFVSVMIVLFQFTDPLKKSIMKRINGK